VEIFKRKTDYNFMGYRKKFLIISIILMISSFVLLFSKGLNFGIDFTGGTIVQVKYEEKAPIEDIRKELEKTDYQGSEVVEFGSKEEIVIKIKKSTTNIERDIGDEVREILKSTGKYEIRRVDIVGAKVGGELREKGIMALILSLVVILIYVSIRFEWRFAVASIFALIHDITITLGFLSLFNIEVNLDILAALLTILGYSLNDTIIVFDRIRESIQRTKEKVLYSLINNSVSKTLSRTTLTSLTTFFVVLTLFLFGGEIINGFAFTLLVGVIVGTYSSIFVAGTFLLQLKFSIENFRNKEAEKEKKRKEKENLRKMYEMGRV